MSITYDWTFSQFDTAVNQDGLSDVVVVVHWRMTAVDGEYIASNYGTVQLPPANPNEFTPFENITKEETIEWVTGAMDVDALKENLAKQIEDQKSPPVVPLPPPFAS